MLYCRQLLARVAQKCCTVVNFGLGWPQNDVLSSIFGSGGPKMLYCRQLLARVAQKCCTVVTFGLGWPQNVVLSSTFGSGGPKMMYCRQFWARVAPTCCTVVNFELGWPKNVVLSSIGPVFGIAFWSKPLWKSGGLVGSGRVGSQILRRPNYRAASRQKREFPWFETHEK